jgi:hypothetical protein
MSSSNYFTSLVEHPTLVSIHSSSSSSSPNSASSSRVVRLGGVHEIMRRAGVEMTLNDAGALLSLCLWPAYPIVSGGISDSSRGDREKEVGDLEIKVSALGRWLCALGSYRHLQTKLRVYLKALAPASCLTYLKEIHAGAGRRGIGSERTRGSVSKSQFVMAVAASAAPLVRAEAQALAELLMRRKRSASGQANGRSSSGRGGGTGRGGGWSWLRDDDDEEEDVEDGSGSSSERDDNVEVALLDRICKGDFISAVL